MEWWKIKKICWIFQTTFMRWRDINYDGLHVMASYCWRDKRKHRDSRAHHDIMCGSVCCYNALIMSVLQKMKKLYFVLLYASFTLIIIIIITAIFFCTSGYVLICVCVWRGGTVNCVQSKLSVRTVINSPGDRGVKEGMFISYCQLTTMNRNTGAKLRRVHVHHCIYMCVNFTLFLSVRPCLFSVICRLSEQFKSLQSVVLINLNFQNLSAINTSIKMPSNWWLIAFVFLPKCKIQCLASLHPYKI